MSHGYGFDPEQDYFHWLCELVHIDQGDASYWILAKDLHQKKFYSLIAHDENRGYDGLELREEYLRDIGYPKYISIDGECSVFEMLIGLARRIDFETSNPYDFDDRTDRTAYWFWEMLDNLNLIQFSDDAYAELKDQAVVAVDWILENFLRRNYNPDGYGGLFPLKNCHENQCNVEIWYQLSAYLLEHEVV